MKIIIKNYKMKTTLTRIANRLTLANIYGFASKELKFGNEARNKMLEGCDLLANAVQVTLGPNGRNVLIDSGYGSVKITKDGVTVAKAIEFSDKFANMGASLVKSVANKANDEAGDGTTTATVLARSIFRQALKKVEVGVNLTEMKKGIDLAVQTVVNQLKKISIPVKDKSHIKSVATISANGDEHIGDLLADLLQKVGNTGVITIGQSKTLKHEVQFVQGMKFDRGFISPYFINNQKAQKVQFQKPLILISQHKVTNFNQILKFLEHAIQKKRPLLIIADDIESEPLTNLILNRVQGSVNVAAVKAPSFGDNRKAILNDIAILTGGTVVSEEVGVTFDESDQSILGTAGKIEITKDDTVLLHGNGDKVALTERINQIKEQIRNATDTYSKEKLQERLSKLSGGVGIIKVGGASEVEVGEIKDRVQDAICATKAAIEQGIVVGGGCALLYASKALETLKGKNAEQDLGIKIIKKAISLPCKTISDNAGFEGITTVQKVLASTNTNFGFDASKGEFVDLIARGIIDPTKVVRVALEDAASVSSYMTTTECMIVDKVQDKPKGGMSGMPGMGGMGGMQGMY